jgi:subtilase family serine protease
VKGWLVSHGFTIEETAKSGAWINFSGTAADVDRAFQANMHDYNVEGQLRHANSNDPSIPRALADITAGPVSLHNFPHKAAHVRPRPAPEGNPRPGFNYTDNGITYHFLAPGDFATIYNVNDAYKQGYDGTGVTIAIAGRTNPNEAQAGRSAFRQAFGLASNPPNVVEPYGNPLDWGGG